MTKRKRGKKRGKKSVNPKSRREISHGDSRPAPPIEVIHQLDEEDIKDMPENDASLEKHSQQGAKCADNLCTGVMMYNRGQISEKALHKHLNQYHQEGFCENTILDPYQMDSGFNNIYLAWVQSAFKS